MPACHWGWNLEVSGGNEGRVLWSNPRYLYGRIFYVGLLVIPHILGSGWECSDLSCSWCLFKHERSQTERERERRRADQSRGWWSFHPSPSLALPLACTWLTVGVKITLEWCLLCHWLTLSRIMDNHHTNRRAAHWCRGVPRWGGGVEVSLFGCHHHWDDMLTDV